MHRVGYLKKINLNWFNSIVHSVSNIQIYTIKTHFLMCNNACLLIQLHVVRETYICTQNFCMQTCMYPQRWLNDQLKCTERISSYCCIIESVLL